MSEEGVKPGGSGILSRDVTDQNNDLPCSRIKEYSFAPNFHAVDKRSVRGKKFRNNEKAFRFLAPLFAVDPAHDSNKYGALYLNLTAIKQFADLLRRMN